MSIKIKKIEGKKGFFLLLDLHGEERNQGSVERKKWHYLAI